MRKAGPSIVVVLLFGATLMLSLVRMQRTQDMAYLERVVGQPLDDCISIDAQRDDAESYVIAVGTIRSSEWRGCRERLGLRRIESSLRPASATPVGPREDLPGELRPPALAPGSFIAAGCARQGTAWLMLVDSSAERFWLEVRHPDMAGDAPACVDVDAYVRMVE